MPENQLPGDLRGILEVERCYFDVGGDPPNSTRSGSEKVPRFLCMGRVITPEEYAGAEVWYIVKICDDNRRTAEEALVCVVNFMRLAGCDLVDYNGDDLEETAEKIQMAEPPVRMRFSTWNRESRVFVSWDERC
jgi:hypothetical protein